MVKVGHSIKYLRLGGQRGIDNYILREKWDYKIVDFIV